MPSLRDEAERIQLLARGLPLFDAPMAEDEATSIQGHLLDALIEITMRLKAAGLTTDEILKGLSEGVTELRGKLEP